MPRTIEDAIQVVLGLDLQYLWVDKYCVYQSSNTGLAQQISIMDKIYNAAFCTIITACGDDALFGLPGVGSTKRQDQPAIRLNGQVWVSSFKNPEPVAEALRGPAEPGYEQVHFECNNTSCRQTVSLGPPLPPRQDGALPGGLFKGSFACEAHGGLGKQIEVYTKRFLPFQSNIINALTGVFRP
ncbi:hypothetical protein FNYG_09821 [Fusarium nygamai]|uniref:Heterokaryon incompatibility domain-containing protein n=1 Tax=Gibberella nygamai TaxID=42673 RepID=A0A2K0W3E3_GIBNY|nr:hypothetical protein FNYG_09821 [Fusarium nygamai]